MTESNKVTRTIVFSMAGNFVLALIKGLGGFFGNSYALIADAIESTVDFFSSLFVWLGFRYANRPADANHPYGHGKAEPLITFIIVGFLICGAVIIAYQSIENIRTPHELPKPYTLIILACILAWKELSFRYVKWKSKETNSTLLEAEAWHHRSDALTSLAAFVGISIALLMGPGFESADDWAALAASGMIIYNSYLIFRPALAEVMDEHLYEDLESKIRNLALQINQVKATEKCIIRKVGMRYFVDLHIEVDGRMTVHDSHGAAHQVKDHIMKNLSEIGDVLIHVEPFRDSG